MAQIKLIQNEWNWSAAYVRRKQWLEQRRKWNEKKIHISGSNGVAH